MEKFFYESMPEGMAKDEIKAAALEVIKGRILGKVLILPPDLTRLHSGAGYITNVLYHALAEQRCVVDIIPALGTHVPMTTEELQTMFGDIPLDRFFEHNWRRDVVKLGEVPADFISKVTEGLWEEKVSAEVNRHVMDPGYDLILSIGQVVPHEVIGMANHAKNLFVGVGGSDMINKTHLIGAIFGMERVMGKDHSPVREIFDYALNNYLRDRPICFLLTVTTEERGCVKTHGMFIGDKRSVLEKAIELSQKKNINFVERSLSNCVVYLDPEEFKSTWLGDKAIYRTRMAMADGGQLLILAPGVTRFGEDPEVDMLIEKYGYCGRERILQHYSEQQELKDNMSVAAHLIHGSTEGRFSIKYAVKKEYIERFKRAGIDAVDYEKAAEKYDPRQLQYGYNAIDGEEVFFIPNPALGLWGKRTDLKTKRLS